MSIPVVENALQTNQKAQILAWWENIEQHSIELSLDYEYLIETDITNCYGALYTHSIAWALHTKDVAKQQRRENLIGNIIDKYIRAMRYGQTNGIPQGSVLMLTISSAFQSLQKVYAHYKMTQIYLHPSYFFLPI